MRHLAIIGSIALALTGACTDYYGTYVTVTGKPADLSFDRVEFYFGEKIGEIVPTTPDRPMRFPEVGHLAKRLFVGSDIQTLKRPDNTLTYYLAGGGHNERLGDYVMAIAYANDVAVGIGELFSFKVEISDVVYLYEIELVPIGDQEVERWGRPETSCVRWTRVRGDETMPSSVAIIAEFGDQDCDSFRVDTDCDELVYCDGSGVADGCVVTCSAGMGPEVATCVLGQCRNSDQGSTPLDTCPAAVCVDNYFCLDCRQHVDPDSFLACALDRPQAHNEAYIPTRVDGTLCAAPYTFAWTATTGCDNPRIEAFVSADGFVPTVATGTSASLECLITLTAPPATTMTASMHVLISYDEPMLLLPRTSFLLGIQREPGRACGEAFRTVPVSPPFAICN